MRIAVPTGGLLRGVSPSPTFAQRGFTLTELAVVLVIVALLIGGMIIPLSTQQDMRNAADSQRALAEISEALVGFAASHSATDGKPYLPCPAAIGGTGVENRPATGACASQEGEVPWATLGVGRQDPWNNAFRYRVDAGFSNNATGFTLGSIGALRVCPEGTCATTLATTLPAVFLSLGKNGASASADADEMQNTNGDNDFVQRIQSSGGYDDVVSWLSPNILFNRMIAAARLP